MEGEDQCARLYLPRRKHEHGGQQPHCYYYSLITKFISSPWTLAKQTKQGITTAANIQHCAEEAGKRRTGDVEKACFNEVSRRRDLVRRPINDIG